MAQYGWLSKRKPVVDDVIRPQLRLLSLFSSFSGLDVFINSTVFDPLCVSVTHPVYFDETRSMPAMIMNSQLITDQSNGI